MTNVKKELLRYIFAMLLLAAPVAANVADGAGVPKEAVPARYGSVSFPNGVSLEVKLPLGWTAGGCENCFTALNGATVRFKMERAGGLAPCLWLNLAAPYMDAPGDRGARVDAIPLVVKKSDGADVPACRGRIVSPKYKLAMYRMLINARGGMLYSMESQAIYWDKEADDRFIAGFEQQLQEFEENIVIREPVPEKKTAKTPAKAKKGAGKVKGKPEKKIEAVKQLTPAPSAATAPAAGKTVVAEKKLSADEQKSRAALEKEKQREEKLLTAAPPPQETKAANGTYAAKNKTSDRPSFAAIKESMRGRIKPYERSEFLVKADRLRLRGKLAEAREAYSALLPSFKYDAVLGIGDIAAAQGDMEGAKKQYALALKLDAAQPYAYNGLGSVAMAKGNDAEAIKYFEKARSLDPENPGTYVNLGWMALKKLRTIDAETFFMKALALKPDLDVAAGAVNGLTSIAFSYGEYEEALNWNRSFLKVFSEYPEAHANMVIAYMNMGNGEGAEAEARKMEEAAERIPQVVILAGRAYLMSGKPGVAADRLCRYTDPAKAQYVPEAITDCVNALEQIARGPEAVEILKKSATPKLITPGIAIMLSERLTMDGDNIEAKKILDMAAAKFPDNAMIKATLEEMGEKTTPQ